jgi:AcrR family transcriptional regulator
MPRAGVTIQRIIDEAATIADEGGLHSVTLATLAQRLNVRVPSLYKHVSGLQDVHEQLAEQSRLELAEAMEQATIGRSGADAVRSLASALRRWALAHPGRYAATVRAQPPGTEPTVGTSRATFVLLRVVAGNEEDARDETIHAARTLRSALHGFIDLELHGGFGLPQGIEPSFDWLIDHIVPMVVSDG